MVFRLKGPSGQPAAIENLQLCFAGDAIIFFSKRQQVIISIFFCSGQGWPEATPRGRALTGTGKYENPHETTKNPIKDAIGRAFGLIQFGQKLDDNKIGSIVKIVGLE